jgi:hypothetical protein
MQSRPLYERASDRQNEAAIIAKVERAWSVKAAKLKTALKLDYALTREGRVVSFAEVKARSYSWPEIRALGGYMLSLDKWVHARALCSGLPFTLVVEAQGELRSFVTRFEGDFPVVLGGRKDRNDWQDMEPCILIPEHRFAPVTIREAA